MNTSILNIMNWSQNKQYNPQTKRKIKIGGVKYNIFQNKYNEYFPNNYSYIDSVEDKDPISHEIFWIINNKNIKQLIYPDINNLTIYKDSHGLVHCFENETLKYMIYYNILNHPVTRELLPRDIFNKIDKIDNIVLSVESKIKNIFSILSSISIFIESDWFLKLNSDQMNILYYETCDFYLNNISNDIKKKLNIFSIKNNKYMLLEFTEKQDYILNCYDKLLIKTSESIYMSSYIIICGLSIVIPQIKQLYPDIIYNL